MAAWRYEISLLMLKKYQHFSGEKFRTSEQPCSILYVSTLCTSNISNMHLNSLAKHNIGSEE